jgi:hypothetical protein
MKAHHIVLLFSAILLFTSVLQAQSTADSTGTKTQKKFQAKAPPTQPFSVKAFEPSNKTTIRWLGMAGFLINSRGTTFMIDPLLEGYACDDSISYRT